MYRREYLQKVEELTQKHLDRADISIAAAENRVLRHTGDKREEAETALTALTLCLVSVFSEVGNEAFFNGLAAGHKEASLRVEPCQP